MKTVLFVPGFQQDLSTNHYQSTLSAINAKGYKTVFVPIQWKRTTIDDWIRELGAEYSKLDPNNTILAGFSYGAMTAFGVAANRLPSELWLFSLSPYFKEDIPLLKLAWRRNIGKQRQERFWRMSFDKLAPFVTCKTLLFVGEKEAQEYPDLNNRVMKAGKLLKNSTVTTVPACDHDVTSRQYIEAIRGAI